MIAGELISPVSEQRLIQVFRGAIQARTHRVTQRTVLDRALALAESGYPVFPCRKNKQPACKHSFNDATTDPGRIRELFATRAAVLIGVPTGPKSGFDVIDLDPRHGADAWEAANPLPETRVHATRSGGKHVLFKADPAIRNSQSKIAPGVDVRGSGGFIIWWPEAGCEVLRAAPLAPWPAAWAALARAPKDRMPRETQVASLANTPSAEAAKQALALAVVEILAAPSGTLHATVRDLCMSVARFVNGGYLDVEEAHVAIIEAAKDAGAEDMNNVENLFWSAIKKARPADAPLDDVFDDLDAKDAIAKRGGRPLMINRIRRPGQITDEPARPYIVKKFIRPGDVCAIIGPPGAGKSMLAPFIGYMIALGREVFGMKSNAGLVLYMAAEDVDGMAMRIKALERTHGTTDNFGLVDVANFREDDEASDAMATVKALNPALVIVDTVGAAWAGMVENDSADMGKVVELARRIAATGACCMLVHHTTKQNDGTARGHSSLQGTLDMLTLLGEKNDEGIVRCLVGKNRAGPSDLDIAFRQSSVTLGRDEDGDTITAPMAVALPSRSPEDRMPVKKLPASLDTALRALTDLIDASGGQAVSVEAWKSACFNDGVFGDGNKFRANFSRARRDLVERKIVSINKDDLANVLKKSIQGLLRPSSADLSEGVFDDLDGI